MKIVLISHNRDDLYIQFLFLSLGTQYLAMLYKFSKPEDGKIFEEFWQLPSMLHWASHVFFCNIYWIIYCLSQRSGLKVNIHAYARGRRLAKGMTGKLLRLPRPRCCPHKEPSSLQGSQGVAAPAAAFAADALEDTINVDPGPTLSYPLEAPDVLNLLQCVYTAGRLTNCSVDTVASPFCELTHGGAV